MTRHAYQSATSAVDTGQPHYFKQLIVKISQISFSLHSASFFFCISSSKYNLIRLPPLKLCYLNFSSVTLK